MKFLDLLSLSCNKIRNKGQFKEISIYCHILYSFLVEKTKLPFCTLSTLKDLIKLETNSCLPTDSSELSSHLLTLDEIGLLFYIVNRKDIDQSWIVVQKEVILCKLDGVLSAPKEFIHLYRNISSKTGVVTESMLMQHFPQYDAQMLASFPTRIELRWEVESSVLKVIINNFTDASNKQVFSKVLFFPMLVDVDRPDEVDGVFEFGLCLQCAHSYKFSTRFFQVLQLHLSYKHALPKEIQTSSTECSLPPGITRKCTV